MPALKLHRDDVMTEAEYDSRREKIRQRETGANHDLALLIFEASNRGWTQESLAAKEGKKQQWVQKWIRFGRFLSITPNGVITRNLTEGGFRRYWKATDHLDNESSRFGCIADWMKRGVTIAPDRVNTSAIIADRFGDRRWHTKDVICRSLHDSHKVGRHAVTKAIKRMRQGMDTVPVTIEVKPAPSKDGGFKYRINVNKTPVVKELDRAKVKKLIAELTDVYDEGQKVTTKTIQEFSPTEAKDCFRRLKGIIDRIKSGKL